MTFYGYAGSILDIDLTSGTVRKKDLPEEMARRYLGGLGFNANILYRELNPGTDPLGPDNILVFSTGPLVGTSVPTACRTEASALSPATGLFGTANSGNYWGGELKCAGYDALIIRGRSEKPVFIRICDGSVEILPAGRLWGKDAWDAIKAVRKDQGDSEMQVAVIGQAGENMVRFASIENGPFDAWARTGLGAVMGSKNLKAVAVRGTGGIKVARPKDFSAALDDTRRAINSSPFYEAFKRFGTMLASIPYYEFGSLPGRNYQTGRPENWMETRTRKQLPGLSNRGVSCQACPIACAHWVRVKDGPYAGLELKDMEVTPVIGFGAGCDIGSLPAIAALSGACQRYGMDMVSASACVAFTMEMYQKGIISRDDLGFDLPWGDEEGTFKLLDMIANRRGIGNILAGGTRLASASFPGSEVFSVHVKGLECFLADPRGRWSTWTFGYITNIRGGDHLRTRNPVENLKYNDNPVPYRTEKFGLPDRVYESLDMPPELKKAAFDPDSRDVNIPVMSKWSEDLISIYNSLGMCIRPPVLHTVGPALFSRLTTGLTGLDISPEDIALAGERTWNTVKLFNLKHGEKPEQSDFPPRFYRDRPADPGKEPLDPGAVKAVLGEYYRARGWDPETGVPTPEKLAELGI
ncbi:MAG: aldehyde ferredoxin oxidoreductase family protein [Peptococcaceae bacterium]|nr:aldehyde ferredoxin oxidoreductase family protein [Peptococcaceae bacterium]